MATLNIAQEILDIIYPIGSVYISIDNIDPTTRFGGTWERIRGEYLMAFDPDSTMDHNKVNTYLGGWSPKVSGTAISVDQMPKHRHGLRVTLDLNTSAGNERCPISGGGRAWSASDTYPIQDNGGGKAHDHTIPTYPVCTRTLNVWYRVS